MCSDTKMKIASVLRALMQERPLSKITVQDIMARANMKRQSFYYHFQDVYEVLEWEVGRALFDNLPKIESVSSEAWFQLLLHMVEADRPFYRKVIQAVGRGRAVRQCCIHVRPQAVRLMMNDSSVPYAQLGDDERVAVDFVTYALVNFLIDSVLSYERLDSKDSENRIAIFCRTAASFRPGIPVSNTQKYGQPA